MNFHNLRRAESLSIQFYEQRPLVGVLSFDGLGVFRVVSEKARDTKIFSIALDILQKSLRDRRSIPTDQRLSMLSLHVSI